MKEITLIVKYSVKNGMVNDFLTALKNEGFPQIVKTKFKKTGGSRCNRKCPKYRQRIALPMKVKYVFFYCSRIDFRLFVQAAKQQAVRLSSDCINGKYLWALPTPTTFEKVDQTFIINWQINLLNHNFTS